MTYPLSTMAIGQPHATKNPLKVNQRNSKWRQMTHSEAPTHWRQFFWWNAAGRSYTDWNLMCYKFGQIVDRHHFHYTAEFNGIPSNDLQSQSNSFGSYATSNAVSIKFYSILCRSSSPFAWYEWVCAHIFFFVALLLNRLLRVLLSLTLRDQSDCMAMEWSVAREYVNWHFRWTLARIYLVLKLTYFPNYTWV